MSSLISRQFRFVGLFTWSVSTLFLLACADAADSTDGTYTLINLDTNDAPVVYTQDSTDEPQNGINTVTFANEVSNTFTELKARSKVDLLIDNFFDSPETWDSIEGDATATSMRNVTGTVEGADGVAGGTLRYNWVVVGDSIHQLDTRLPPNTTENSVDVDEYYTSAKLTATLDNSDTILLDKMWAFPGTNSSDDFHDVTIPAAADVPSFFTSNWLAGTEVDVLFALDVASHFKFSNDNEKTTKFTALLDANFFGTATLESVDVLHNGQLLPNARLVGPDGAYPNSVPEPSHVLIFLGISIAVAWRQFAGRAACAMHPR